MTPLVRRAYHLAERDVPEAQGFIDPFAENRVIQPTGSKRPR